jgi:hypothetical protein
VAEPPILDYGRTSYSGEERPIHHDPPSAFGAWVCLVLPFAALLTRVPLVAFPGLLLFPIGAVIGLSATFSSRASRGTRIAAGSATVFNAGMTAWLFRTFFVEGICGSL